MTSSTQNELRLESLGQSGLKIDLNNLTILVDPYLSNSVELLDSPDMRRQADIPYRPNELIDVDWILITHDHLDHCDPYTIPALSYASPHAQFLGPPPVIHKLIQWGIEDIRIKIAPTEWFILGQGLSVKAFPAAHPKIRLDADGHFQAVGWMFKLDDRKLYVAGDTSLCDELLIALKKELPIQAALLPVNEDNFFRRRRGIIGNMSIREAFGLAEELNISLIAPVHWDLFEINNALHDEIYAVYKGYHWNFKLTNVQNIRI